MHHPNDVGSSWVRPPCHFPYRTNEDVTGAASATLAESSSLVDATGRAVSILPVSVERRVDGGDGATDGPWMG